MVSLYPVEGCQRNLPQLFVTFYCYYYYKKYTNCSETLPRVLSMWLYSNFKCHLKSHF